MKKLIIISLIVSMGLSFVGCNSEKQVDLRESVTIDEEEYVETPEMKVEDELIQYEDVQIYDLSMEIEEQYNLETEFKDNLGWLGEWDKISEKIKFSSEINDQIECVRNCCRSYKHSPNTKNEICDIIILDLDINTESESKTKICAEELKKDLESLYSEYDCEVKIGYNFRYVWAYCGDKLQGANTLLNERLFIN